MTQTLIYSHEFSKLKDESWQTWTDFEKDLKEFELKTSTPYRLDKSDLVKTANNKRQRLGQAVIPDEVKYMQAVYVCCHFGQCQLKARGLLSNENVEGMYQYQVFYGEEGTTSTDGVTYIISNHVLWNVRQNA